MDNESNVKEITKLTKNIYFTPQINVHAYANLDYVKLHESAHDFNPPNEGNAGYDLYACRDHHWNELDNNRIITVDTGLAIEIPAGFAGLILGRSGNAFSKNVYCAHVGLIDSIYRGELKVRLQFLGIVLPDVIIRVGDKIGQLLIVPYLYVNTRKVDRLSKTTRGTNGFGSSGGNVGE